MLCVEQEDDFAQQRAADDITEIPVSWWPGVSSTDKTAGPNRLLESLSQKLFISLATKATCNVWIHESLENGLYDRREELGQCFDRAVTGGLVKSDFDFAFPTIR